MKRIRRMLVLIAALMLSSALLITARAASSVSAPEITAKNVSSTGKVQITWDAVENATKYKVYSSTSKSGTYSHLITTTKTKVTNSSAVAGKTYYYYVRAVDADGNQSAKSNIVNRTCDLPAPVVSATNVASTGKIKLTWDAVDGAVKYSVYCSTSKNGTYSRLITTTDTKVTNTSAVAGKTYYYKVKAIAQSSSADSAYSSVVYRTCDLPAPEVSATNVASTGKIKLTWDAVDGAVKYSVYCSTSKNGTYSRLITTTDTKVTNTSAVAGKTYYYKVKAIAQSSSADSAYSSVVYRTCDLKRPVISAKNNSSGYEVIQWSAIDGAVEYQLYRATSKNGTYSKIATVTGTKYTDKNATANKTYYYKLRAVASQSAANSAYSSIISAMRIGEKLSTPVISVSRNSDRKPVVTWKAISDATGYEVYRATSADGKFTLMKTTTATKYTNTGATDYVTYYYKVRAIADDGARYSNFSEVKSVVAGVEFDDQFETAYVLAPHIYVYKETSTSGDSKILKYMEEVQLGADVGASSSGTWKRLIYQKKVYYTWVPAGTTKFTATKSNYDYTNKNNTDLQNEVIEYALSYKDLPTYYTHDQSTGIINPDNGKYGFDCSGFASHVINAVVQKYNPLYKLDRNLTKLHETGTSSNTTGILYNNGYANSYKLQTISRKNMQPGDVIFFKVDDGDSKDIDHCGIYLGNQEFIHATSFHDGVCIMPLSGNYDEGFVTVRRYYPAEITPSNQTLKTNYRYVYLYAQRDDSSERLYSFSMGETVTLLFTSTNDTWGYVRTDDGLEGYVLMKRFDLAE